MRILDREDLLNIMAGCTILGTGGGGSPEEGIQLIDEALSQGKRFRLAAFDELEPDAIIGTPYACGAISPLTEEERKKYAHLKQAEESMYQMFRGVVAESRFETRDGYTFGDTVLEGTGAYAGHSLRIWYQNENIISWMDGAPRATVPDLICAFDLDNAAPQLNPYARVGERAAVIVLPAPKEWTTPRGLEVFGPGSFHHDIEYKSYCQRK